MVVVVIDHHLVDLVLVEENIDVGGVVVQPHHHIGDTDQDLVVHVVIGKEIETEIGVDIVIDLIVHHITEVGREDDIVIMMMIGIMVDHHIHHIEITTHHILHQHICVVVHLLHIAEVGLIIFYLHHVIFMMVLIVDLLHIIVMDMAHSHLLITLIDLMIVLVHHLDVVTDNVVMKVHPVLAF